MQKKVKGIDKYMRQFKKGVLELVVLRVLKGQSMYGYEIVGDINTRYPGLGIREGTLYPILYRLEDDGLVAAVWEENKSARGVPKKYYVITEEGVTTLRRASAQWMEFANTITEILKD